MKLIDANEIIRDLMEEIPLAENVSIFKEIIENQPTAYDIDKVVKELEKFNTDECTLHECGIRSEFCGKCMISKAIEIVENGLKEKK